LRWSNRIVLIGHEIDVFPLQFPAIAQARTGVERRKIKPFQSPSAMLTKALTCSGVKLICERSARARFDYSARVNGDNVLALPLH
jgi:hypothetical protein